MEDYGAGAVELYRSAAGEVISFTGIAAFEVSRREIRAVPFAPGLDYLIEICFVGNVMSYWLERTGTIMLHASAVRVGEGCAAFLAGTSRGKTTIAAACLAAGCDLVSDDILPLKISSAGVYAVSGFPQMKLLPSQLELLGGSPGNYVKIHPKFEKLKVPMEGNIGSYCSVPLPLKGIYMLDRVGADDASGVRLCGAAEAVLSLVAHSFAAELVDAVDRGQGRLEKLGRVSSLVPVKRLGVPDGYSRLNDAVRTVLEDEVFS